MTSAGTPPAWPLSVVIPARDPGGGVDRLLAVLAEQAAAVRPARVRPLPVIVSDDDSSPPLDRLAGAITEPAMAVEVHRSERNGGPGAARNRGLARVGTEWVVFLDADTVPAPGWLPTLLGLVEEPGAPDGIRGSLAIPPDEAASPFTHATDHLDPGGGVGGNVAYRTAVLRAEGGFDERYYDARRRIHFREDTALQFRLAAGGRRVAWRPELQVLHPPLPRSYRSPIRLARRYYFDPLLAREHPAEFAAMNRERRLGPLSLRRARHLAGMGQAASLALLGAGVIGRQPVLRVAGAAGLAASWPANVTALAWRRRVGRRDVLPLLAVAAVAPLSYAWHHTRGVVAFRHWPRY